MGYCFDSGDYEPLSYTPEVASINTTEVPLAVDPIYQKYDTYDKVWVETQVEPGSTEETDLINEIEDVIATTKRKSLIQAGLFLGAAYILFGR